MGGEKDKISCFVKDEATYSFSSNSFNNYTMFGVKKNLEAGSLEGGLAFKASDSQYGGFAELKLTSEELVKNISAESRTRLSIETPYNDSRTSLNIGQRIALKGSWNLGKRWNIYEIAGASLNLDLQEGNVTSVGPTSVTGVGYKINKNASIYGEASFSKSYKPIIESWDKLSSSFTLGVKIGL